MFIRFVSLIVPPVLAFLFWNDIMRLVPAGNMREWLPFAAVVLYGLLMLVFGLKPRPGSRVAALEAMVQKQHKVLAALSEGMGNDFNSLKRDMADVKTAQARTGKSLISVDQLMALQAFDPELNTKLPHLMALAEALGKIDIPQLNLAHLNDLVTLAQHMDRLALLHQSLTGIDVAALTAVTDRVGALLDAVQRLSLDGEGDHRDYDDIKRIITGVADVLQVVPPMLAATTELTSRDQQVVDSIKKVDGIIESLGDLATDGNNDVRHFGILRTVAVEATETLQVAAELVKPENGFSTTLPNDLKVVGKIVQAVEEVVLDGDGDAIDFGNTADGVKSLDELTSAVVPLVQRVRQTG